MVRLQLRALVWAGLVAIALVLSGCGGLFRDRYPDYQLEGSVTPIQVPQDLDQPMSEPLMPIPGPMVGSEGKVGVEVPRPEPLQLAQHDERASLRDTGDDQWLLVAASPAEVWPELVTHLEARSMKLTHRMPERGLLETGWLDRKDGGRQRFRLRVEEGIRNRTTEVRVLQQSVTGPVNASRLPWPRSSTDKAQETALLQALRDALAQPQAEGGASQVSLRAQALSGTPRSRLASNEQGEPALYLAVEYARAWSAIEAAIERLDWPLEDKDRSAARFYLVVDQEPEGKPGFWARLFGATEEDADAGRAYQLQLTPVEGGIEVSVVAEPADALNAETKRRLLSQIRESLL